MQVISTDDVKSAATLGADIQDLKWVAFTDKQFEQIEREISAGPHDFLGSMLINVKDDRGNHWAGADYADFDHPKSGRNNMKYPFVLPNTARLEIHRR